MSNIIKVKINDGNKDIFETQLSINEPVITINDDFVLNIVRPFNIDKKSIKHCYFTFGLTNAFVNIIDYSLTDEVYIESFFNQPSYIAFLKCIDTKLHIVKQNVEKMQIDGDSVLVAECKINEIIVGLNKQMKILQDNKEIKDAIIHINKIDIRASVISEVEVLASCDYVNIQESDVKILRFGNMFGKSKSIEKINIWRNCSINTIELSCPINEIKIADSTIYSIMSKSQCKINSIDIDQSLVENAYNFNLKIFKNVNLHSWLLISKSASLAKDIELRAKANYNISNLYMKEKSLITKIPMMFFKITTGYGYKPFRVIWFSIIAVLLFGGLYSLLDIFAKFSNVCSISEDVLLNIFWDKLIFSFTSFAGASGNPNLRTEYLLTLLENILGVVTFAMFVNALFVKYKE